MSKLTLNKLGITKNLEVEETQVNYKEFTITVKNFLPMEEYSKCLAAAAERIFAASETYTNMGFLEAVVYVYATELITDISFTDKQKEDVVKTYSLMESNLLFEKLADVRSFSQLIEKMITDVMYALKQMNTRKQSLIGMLESMQKDYNNFDLDIKKLQEEIKDPESLDILKSIAPMIGLA